MGMAVVVEKGRKAIVTALCDMVGISVSDDASDSWHIVRIERNWARSNFKCGECPLFFPTPRKYNCSLPGFVPAARSYTSLLTEQQRHLDRQ